MLTLLGSEASADSAFMLQERASSRSTGNIKENTAKRRNTHTKEERISWIRKGRHTPTKSTTTEHQESNAARDDQGDTHLHDKRRAPSRPTDVQHNKIKHRAKINTGNSTVNGHSKGHTFRYDNRKSGGPSPHSRAQVKRGNTLHVVKRGHQTRLSRGGAQRTKQTGEAYITRGGNTIKKARTTRGHTL